MSWYRFRQNNSGGVFDFDQSRGISAEVYVEAQSFDHANDRARSIGLYFDENYEIDCDCCGMRWHEADSWNVVEGYEVPAENDPLPSGNVKWMGDDPETFVHPLDGDFYSAHSR